MSKAEKSKIEKNEEIINRDISILKRNINKLLNVKVGVDLDEVLRSGINLGRLLSGDIDMEELQRSGIDIELQGGGIDQDQRQKELIENVTGILFAIILLHGKISLDDRLKPTFTNIKEIERKFNEVLGKDKDSLGLPDNFVSDAIKLMCEQTYDVRLSEDRSFAQFVKTKRVAVEGAPKIYITHPWKLTKIEQEGSNTYNKYQKAICDFILNEIAIESIKGLFALCGEVIEVIPTESTSFGAENNSYYTQYPRDDMVVLGGSIATYDARITNALMMGGGKVDESAKMKAANSQKIVKQKPFSDIRQAKSPLPFTLFGGNLISFDARGKMIALLCTEEQSILVNNDTFLGFSGLVVQDQKYSRMDYEQYCNFIKDYLKEHFGYDEVVVVTRNFPKDKGFNEVFRYNYHLDVMANILQCPNGRNYLLLPKKELGLITDESFDEMCELFGRENIITLDLTELEASCTNFVQPSSEKSVIVMAAEPPQSFVSKLQRVGFEVFHAGNILEHCGKAFAGALRCMTVDLTYAQPSVSKVHSGQRLEETFSVVHNQGVEDDQSQTVKPSISKIPDEQRLEKALGLFYKESVQGNKGKRLEELEEELRSQPRQPSAQALQEKGAAKELT